ncbi:MAG TPA: HTTM domain-containing protein [Bacteroidota bacterium]|nr:HTTM domain-containing protein [Bacteroidota bacterium]
MRRFLVLFSLIIIAASIGGWIWWSMSGDRVIEAAFNGRSLPYVNKYVSIHRSIDPEHRTLEYFLRNGRPVLPRLFGLIIVVQILFLVALRYGTSTIKNFFSEVSHPINLAIFRVVLFSAVLFYCDIPQVIQFSGFPSALRVAPFGLGWLLTIVPINPAWALALSCIFILACVSGLVGFFSRTSAGVAAVLGLYVLGVPQFFGKIDHYHHLLWFLAILAAAPCGDALSLDSLLGARKNKNVAPLQPSSLYAIPLRFVMLLLGIIYFFAGAWKFIIGGIGWATTDTMKDMLYAQWFRLGWMPLFRIDQHPLLCTAAGLGVMFFELTFIFFVFFPSTRKAAAVGGLLFHLAIYLFAHINFWSLAVCYVAFVDFVLLFRRLPNANFRFGIFGSHQEIADRQLQIVNRKSKPVIIIGGMLLVINVLCGITLVDSWPFAVYPTFAGVEEKYLQSLSVILDNPDGTRSEIVPYEDRALQTVFHPSRMIGLFTQVLWAQDSVEVHRRGMALLHLLKENDPRFRQASSMRLYEDICSVIPEESEKNPVRRKLLLSLP